VRKMNRVSFGQEKRMTTLPTTPRRLEAKGRFKGRSEKDLLLRHPNFVAKPTTTSFEPPPLACEASALTTELTAQNQS